MSSHPTNPPWSFSATVMGWGEGGGFSAQQIALNRIFSRYASRPYSSVVEHFYFHFYVGGSMGDTKLEGPSGIRIYRPRKYIHQTISVPRMRWQATDFELALYITDCIFYGTDLIHERLRQNRIEYDALRMNQELERSLNRFLSWGWQLEALPAKRRKGNFGLAAKGLVEEFKKSTTRRSRDA